ncbi:hypothetical protein [Brevundimonas sp. SL130]|uniref:hypothetical protein n=1 Tax=Brevundimonas sp. SL130 TaxID=2995143 RepID=UPI00226D23F3|nr:hypothetical protein [Brevundimonas sp. SL130]WAC59195.1 hypothetical protein OU998_13350 [Brevundimonas sp. SL130]
MFKVLIPAAAAIALVAFAAGAPSSESFAAQPAAASAMRWHLSHEGAMAKLAYGVENSDQLALMVTCSPGDSTAVVYGDVQPDTPRPGDSTAVVYGDVQPDTPRLIAASQGPSPIDPLSDGDAAETRLSLHDASLTGLVSTGLMQVRGEAGAFALRAGADERRMIAGFLTYCGSSRA